MDERTQQSRGLTVGELARAGGLSRSTLLYYDRIGLLRPAGRSAGNYRLYGQADLDRLRQVCFYRRMGVPLADIVNLLRADEAAGQAGRILHRRLQALEQEIESLQEQQREIVRVLEQMSKPSPAKRQGHTDRPARTRQTGAGRQSQESLIDKESAVISKQRWVEILSAAGFSEEDMKRWHRTFEQMEPQGHQEFLESLGIDGDEIARIRGWARK